MSKVSPSTTCVTRPEISIPSFNVGAGNVGVLFSVLLSECVVLDLLLELLLFLELLLSSFLSLEEEDDFLSLTFSQWLPSGDL